MLLEAQKGPPFRFDPRQQKAVVAAIESLCDDLRFGLRSIKVTPTYLNLVIEANGEPEDVIEDLRAAVTFQFMNRGLVAEGTRILSDARFRHFLWDENAVLNAIEYTKSQDKECLPTYDEWMASRSN